MHRIRLKRLPKNLLVIWVINWTDKIADTWTVRFYHGHFYDADTERFHCWTLRELGVSAAFILVFATFTRLAMSHISFGQEMSHPLTILLL